MALEFAQYRLTIDIGRQNDVRDVAVVLTEYGTSVGWFALGIPAVGGLAVPPAGRLDTSYASFVPRSMSKNGEPDGL